MSNFPHNLIAQLVSANIEDEVPSFFELREKVTVNAVELKHVFYITSFDVDYDAIDERNDKLNALDEYRAVLVTESDFRFEDMNFDIQIERMIENCEHCEDYRTINFELLKSDPVVYIQLEDDSVYAIRQSFIK